MSSSILLAILPFSSFFLQRFFCNADHQMTQFKHHWTVLYGDWIFVPFNIVFPFAVFVGTMELCTIAVISVALNSGTHITWAVATDNCHFYTPRTHALSKAGIVHLLFSIVECAMIFLFIFFAQNVWYTMLGCVTLMAFSFCLPYGSYRLHGKFTLIEGVVGAALFMTVLVKLLLLIW